MPDNRTLYERNVQGRSRCRYILGLIVRWKQHWKHVRARRIARKNGATIGEGVVMPVSLAKKCNHNLTVGDHTSIQTDDFSSFRYPVKIGSHVIIGGNVRFVMGSHDIDSPDWENIRRNDGLVIEDYVWLCPNSMILPSVRTIGYGSVIGAGAVVAKDVGRMAVGGVILSVSSGNASACIPALWWKAFWAGTMRRTGRRGRGYGDEGSLQGRC